VGWTPLALVPVMSLGEDFAVVLQVADPTFTWPDGTTITAEVYAMPYPSSPPPVPQFSWPGTISADGTEVSFKAESADTPPRRPDRLDFQDQGIADIRGAAHEKKGHQLQFGRWVLLHPGCPKMDTPGAECGCAASGVQKWMDTHIV
jgi:hypothetical protein